MPHGPHSTFEKDSAVQQELIDRIKAKADVSDETATAAAEAVIGFFKDKLPDSLGEQLDNIAAGQSPTEAFKDSVTDKFSSIGGMFDGD